MMKRSLIAVGLFFLGCVTAGVASRVAPVQAQPGSTEPARTHWEYRCISESQINKLQAQANDVGKGGWELAAAAMTGTTSFANPVWCFKRRS
jgi:hypothetical protein